MLGRACLLTLTTTVGASQIRTPAGLWPEECFHQLPSGTKISHDEHGVHYEYPDGSKQTRAACASAPKPDLPHRGSQAIRGTARENASAVEAHGYPVILWGNTDSGLTSLTTNLNVPEAPASFTGQTIFWWPGVEPQSASDVLQPVLGYNAFNNGDKWTYASWNCCPSGHQHYSTPLNVTTGDTLFGSIESTGGEGYTVLSQFGDQKSILQSNDAIAQVMPLLSMEVYDADCSSLPQSCMTMTQISVSPSTTWAANSPQGFGLHSECGWTLSVSGATLSACPPSTRHSNTSNVVV